MEGKGGIWNVVVPMQKSQLKRQFVVPTVYNGMALIRSAGIDDKQRKCMALE